MRCSGIADFLQASDLQVAGGDPAQPAVGDQVITQARQTPQAA